jgi:hypothetical protein
MARDGSGNYSLPQAAYVDGTTIEADDMNSNLSDIAAALTQSISKDGQTTYTASQPMGGFKLTGLGAGTGAGESVRYDEFHTVDLNLAAAFRSHLAGLTTSRASATTIGVAAGSCADSTNAVVMSVSAGTIDCATTGANGLDAGSLANTTWYYVFAIAKADRTTAVLASASLASPTLPTGYTLKRRIGSFKTDGSAQIIPFTQTGDRFQLTAEVRDQNALSTGGSKTLASVPPGIVVEWDGRVVVLTAAAGFIVDVQTVGVTSANSSGVVSGNAQTASGQARVLTNTTQQVALNNVTGTITYDLYTTGWIDRRGRDD